MENHYETLKVANFADIEVVRASYKALAKKYHPDLNENIDPNIMVRMNLAYEVLGSEKTKSEYDKNLKEYLERLDDLSSEKIINMKHERNYEFEDDEKVSIFRMIIAFFVTFVLALIANSVLLMFISSESNWLYFCYIIFGSFFGTIYRKISGNSTSINVFLGCICVIGAILLPFAMYSYESIDIIYGNMNVLFKLGIVVKDVVDLFLLDGFFRAIFCLLTLSAVGTTIADE